MILPVEQLGNACGSDGESKQDVRGWGVGSKTREIRGPQCSDDAFLVHQPGEGIRFRVVLPLKYGRYDSVCAIAHRINIRCD